MSKHHDLDATTFCREKIKDINYGVDMEKLVGMIKKGTLRFEQ